MPTKQVRLYIRKLDSDAFTIFVVPNWRKSDLATVTKASLRRAMETALDYVTKAKASVDGLRFAGLNESERRLIGQVLNDWYEKNTQPSEPQIPPSQRDPLSRRSKKMPSRSLYQVQIYNFNTRRYDSISEHSTKQAAEIAANRAAAVHDTGARVIRRAL